MPITKLELLAADNVEVSIFHFKRSDYWSVTLEKNSDSIRLRVQHDAPDLLAAIQGAVEKWHKIVGQGVEEFRGPLLEAPTTMGEILNDEIPF